MELPGAQAWEQPKRVRPRRTSASSKRMDMGDFVLGRRQEAGPLVVTAMETEAEVVAEGHRTDRHRTRDRDPLTKGLKCPPEATRR